MTLLHFQFPPIGDGVVLHQDAKRAVEVRAALQAEDGDAIALFHCTGACGGVRWRAMACGEREASERRARGDESCEQLALRSETRTCQIWKARRPRSSTHGVCSDRTTLRERTCMHAHAKALACKRKTAHSHAHAHVPGSWTWRPSGRIQPHSCLLRRRRPIRHHLPAHALHVCMIAHHLPLASGLHVTLPRR